MIFSEKFETLEDIARYLNIPKMELELKRNYRGKYLTPMVLTVFLTKRQHRYAKKFRYDTKKIRKICDTIDKMHLFFGDLRYRALGVRWEVL